MKTVPRTHAEKVPGESHAEIRDRLVVILQARGKVFRVRETAGALILQADLPSGSFRVQLLGCTLSAVRLDQSGQATPHDVRALLPELWSRT